MKAKTVALVAALLFAAGGALGAEKGFDFGKREYDSNCASCHGVLGKGDGPLKPWLAKSAPDITGLAKASGGTFPFGRVWAVIDGREAMGAHGPREMPVWGQEYLVLAGEYYMDTPYDPEAFVRSRILALIDYLNRIQKR